MSAPSLAAMRRPPISSELGLLPRFSVLAIHIRAALYGYHDERVQHMVERNRTVEAWRKLEALR